MPQILLPGDMGLQFFSTRGWLVVDLNCGWYCLQAARLMQNGAAYAAIFPLAPPGLGAWGYDVATSGEITLPRPNKPTTCLGWYNMLLTDGPVIVSGKLGGADWGYFNFIVGHRRLGVPHYILINGADTDADQAKGGRLFYLDPLQGNSQKHGTFNHMDKRIDPQVDIVK